MMKSTDTELFITNFAPPVQLRLSYVQLFCSQAWHGTLTFLLKTSF